MTCQSSKCESRGWGGGGGEKPCGVCESVPKYRSGGARGGGQDWIGVQIVLK